MQQFGGETPKFRAIRTIFEPRSPKSHRSYDIVALQLHEHAEFAITSAPPKSIDELRENLTDELVSLARSGQLARWFASRNFDSEAAIITEALAAAPDNATLFASICNAIDVEVSAEDIHALFSEAPPGGTRVPPPNRTDVGSAESPHESEANAQEMSQFMVTATNNRLHEETDAPATADKAELTNKVAKRSSNATKKCTAAGTGLMTAIEEAVRSSICGSKSK